MSKLKRKLLLWTVSLIACFSFVFAPVFSVINAYGSTYGKPEAEQSESVTLSEAEGLALADTSSAFNDDYSNKTETKNVTGEHYVVVTLEGSDLISASSGDLNDYLATASAARKKAKIAEEQSAFLASLDKSAIPYTLKYSYSTVINAVAIKVDVKYLDAISRISGVYSAEVSEYYYAPMDHAVSNQANVWGTGIYKVDGVAAGYSGEGMVVAVLDTGLDSSHAAFRTMPASARLNKEEVKNKIFDETYSDTGLLAMNKKVTVDNVYYNEKVPFAYDYADNDPDVYPSYSSHGTHVAGIIAGTATGDIIRDLDGNPILDKEGNEMTFLGVAPNAQLAICKVFTDKETAEGLGGAETVDILAALEDCVKLGVDVINMSLGSSAGFSGADDAHMQEVYDNVRKTGISLMVAASNDYSSAYNGVYGINLATNPDSATVGSPSTFESSMSVASINGQKARYIRIGNSYDAQEADKFLYFTEASDGNGNQKKFVTELLEKYSDKLVNGVLKLDYQVVPGYGLSVNYTRNIDVKGKVAVVRRGGDVTFEEKVRVAKSKGAVACVIYNNVSGVIRMSLGNLHDPVPTCSITMDAASGFVSNARGSFYISDSYRAGPFMSDFSSWGPTPDLRLKPEISAHGGEITSAVPNGWDEYSGTSMATPNLAGAMSLVLGYVEKNKSVFNPSVETGTGTNDRVTISNRLMMSTATIAYDEFGYPYSPRKQGAGLADINKAMTTKAYIYIPGSDKTKIEVYDDPNKTGVYDLVFSVYNFSDGTRSYKIDAKTMTETIATDGLTVAERAYMLDSLCDLTVSGNNVSGNVLTLAAGASSEVTVTVRLKAEAKNYIDTNFKNGMYVEGFVTLKDLTGDESAVDLNVPWLGFYGDWYAAPMFDISEYELADALKDDSIPDEEKPKAAMYATVPLGSYKNKQYIIPLGTYLYELPDDARKIYSSSDKAALSIYDEKGHYTVNELYAIYAGLLRGAKEMNVVITDAVTGEVVYNETKTNVRKAYTGGSSTARAAFVEMKWSPVDLKLDNNKQYLFHMDGKLDSIPRADRQYNADDYEYGKSFDFNFYIDTEAPEIVDYRVRYESYKDANEKIKYNVYLDVDVYDNHYAQSVALCYADMNKMTLELLESKLQPVYSTCNSTTTVTLDITDYYNTEKDIYIQVDDYALNARAYRVSNFKSFADSVDYPEDVEITSGSVVSSDEYSREITISKNEAYKLGLSVTPSTAASVNLLWKSFNEKVVTVKDGELFGKTAGDAIVRVYGGSNEHSDVTDAILVHVVDGDKNAPTISKLTLDLIRNADGALVNPTNAYVDVNQNEQFKMSAIIEPWYYSGTADIRWTSTAPDVASVSAKGGVVKTLKEGSATIKATLFIDGKQTIYTVSAMLTVGPEFVVQNGYLREYHGPGGKVTIPKSLNVYYVYEEAFKDNDNITELEISSPCTEIQPYAFSHMTRLERVVLPSTVNYVYRYAFSNCYNLKSIELHSRSITFGAHAFENCNSLKTIKNVKLINGLKQEDVEILSLTEGRDYTTEVAKLTTVGDYAFKGCTSITSLDLTELRVAGINAFEGCTALKEVTLSKFTAVSDDMFFNCKSLSVLNYTDVTADDLTALYHGNAVSPFGNCAVSKINVVGGYAEANGENFVALYDGEDKTTLLRINQTLKSFTVPESVTTIAPNALAGSKIESVTIGSNVETIGNYAFSGCGYLTGVTLPASVKNMGVGVFSWCEGLTSADLSALTIAKLPEMTFMYAGDLSEGIKFNSALTSLGVRSFAGSRISSLDLSSTNVTEIDDYAFMSCSLLDHVVFGKITNLGRGVLAAGSETSLTGVEFGEGSDVLGTYTFAGQIGLKSDGISFSDKQKAITEIGDGVFRNCISIVSLPFTVKVAGESAFENCVSLKDINLTMLSSAERRSFKNCVSLESATFDNATVIGDEAFKNCYKLKTANFVAAGKVGESAFENCTTLNVSSLGTALRYIGKYAFRNTGIKADTFVVPVADGQFIGEGAFAALTGVKAFNVTGTSAYYSDDLGMIIKRVENGLEIIAYPAGASGEAVLPEGTVRVAASAFENAKNVTKITFPYSFKAIGDKGFYGAGATEYVFGCLSAPVLEAQYIIASEFDSSDDMYKILDEDGTVVSEKYYGNYKDYVAKVLYHGKYGVKGIKDLGLKAYVPQNATGFESRVYAGFFSTVVKTELIADDTARNCNGLIASIPSAEQIEALTAADVTTWQSFRSVMKSARSAYNLVSTEQRAFVTEAAKLLSSEAAMRSKAALFNETPVETGINVSTLPNKTTYVRGETFDKTGMVLSVTWSDGSKVEITDGFTVLTTTKLTENNRTVRIKYHDLTTSLTVNVIKPEVSSIEINTAPSQTEYEIGDEFSTAGLSIKVNYVDGTSEIVYSGFEATHNEFVVGENVVTVEYMGKTLEIKVTVKDDSEPDKPEPKPDDDNKGCGTVAFDSTDIFGGFTLIALSGAFMLIREKNRKRKKDENDL